MEFFGRQHNRHRDRDILGGVIDCVDERSGCQWGAQLACVRGTDEQSEGYKHGEYTNDHLATIGRPLPVSRGYEVV